MPCRRRSDLAADAVDLRLPISVDALSTVEAALDDYLETQARICLAASELRQAMRQLQRQREQEALGDLRHSNERCMEASIQAEQSETRLSVLRESIGAKVEELQRKLSEARVGIPSIEALTSEGGRRARIMVPRLICRWTLRT
jgi:hypothetical protein